MFKWVRRKYKSVTFSVVCLGALALTRAHNPQRALPSNRFVSPAGVLGHFLAGDRDLLSSNRRPTVALLRGMRTLGRYPPLLLQVIPF